MNVPRNVLRFEVLLYISLMLDAVSVAVQDRTPTAEISDTAIMVQTTLNGIVIVLTAYFVYLAAQHRKNWPRWVMLTALVLSGISLTLFLSDKGMTLDAGIEIISCVLTAIGLYYSFTGDARGWFNA
jgi:protein-S-isoprenylcysteine O-methyltransferase Ste14